MGCRLEGNRPILTEVFSALREATSSRLPKMVKEGNLFVVGGGSEVNMTNDYTSGGFLFHYLLWWRCILECEHLSRASGVCQVL